MVLSANIIHRTPGRMRLQLAKQDCSKETMAEAIDVLRGVNSLGRVAGNPLTRTILIESPSEDHLQTALTKVAQSTALHIYPSKKDININPEPVSHTLRRYQKQVDSFILQATDGRLDFKTSMAFILAGLGINQMIQDRFLPAGFTLVMYAKGFLDLDEDGDD